MDRALSGRTRCPDGQFGLTIRLDRSGHHDLFGGDGEVDTETVDLLPDLQINGAHWVNGIDLCEHHHIDFEEAARRGVRAAIVRAGRGTRQDSRWVESARSAGAHMAIGSYWYLYPSRTTPHHQAELWAAAISTAPVRFPVGHWLCVGTADGFAPVDLGNYVAACLRRTDDLIGQTVGVCTASDFWRRSVRFDIGDRPRWECPTRHPFDVVGSETDLAQGAVAVCIRPADRGGPGIHRLSPALVEGIDGLESQPGGLHLVVRAADETVLNWQRRWLCSARVAELQEHLVALGAHLVIDGVYGPATDAAVRAWHQLQRRDHLRSPSQGGDHRTGLDVVPSFTGVAARVQRSPSPRDDVEPLRS